MKRAAVLVSVVLALSACGSGGTWDTTVDSREVPLPDGRTVTCVVSDGSYSGGVDCDWSGAR